MRCIKKCGFAKEMIDYMESEKEKLNPVLFIGMICMAPITLEKKQEMLEAMYEPLDVRDNSYERVKKLLEIGRMKLMRFFI